MYALARNLLKNDVDAADISQEVFLTLFRKITTIKNPEAGLAWIDRTTVNLIHNARQKNRLHENAVSLDDLPPDGDSHGSVRSKSEVSQTIAPEANNNEELPGLSMERGERDALVLDLVRSLPEKLGEVLVLRYWGEYRATEIAELLGESESAITTRLSRGRKELLDRLTRFSNDHEGARFWAATMGITSALQRMSIRTTMAPPSTASALWKTAPAGYRLSKGLTGAKSSTGAKTLLIAAAVLLIVGGATAAYESGLIRRARPLGAPPSGAATSIPATAAASPAAATSAATVAQSIPATPTPKPTSAPQPTPAQPAALATPTPVPPTLILIHSTLSYAAGTRITAARLIADSGAAAHSATGAPCSITLTGLTRIDSSAPGIYLVFVHATDAAGLSAHPQSLEVDIE